MFLLNLHSCETMKDLLFACPSLSFSHPYFVLGIGDMRTFFVLKNNFSLNHAVPELLQEICNFYGIRHAL